MESREFRIWVRQSRIAAFRQWVKDHGIDFFNFVDWVKSDFRTDPPIRGPAVEARIRGGRVTLRYVDDTRVYGERYFEGRVTIEGFLT